MESGSTSVSIQQMSDSAWVREIITVQILVDGTGLLRDWSHNRYQRVATLLASMVLITLQRAIWTA